MKSIEYTPLACESGFGSCNRGERFDDVTDTCMHKNKQDSRHGKGKYRSNFMHDEMFLPVPPSFMFRFISSTLWCLKVEVHTHSWLVLFVPFCA